jgi:ATP-binding cassette subfamily B protein
MFTDIISIGSIAVLVSAIVDPARFIGNFFNEDIVQYIISIDPYQRAIYGSWIIIFIFLIKNIGIFLSNYALNNYIFNLKIYLSNNLFKFYLNKKYLDHLNINPAVISKNLVREINIFVNSMRIYATLTGNIILLLGLMLLVTLNFKIYSIIVLSIVAVVAYISVLLFKKSINKISIARSKSELIVFKTINETFNFIKEINLFKIKNLFYNKFSENLIKTERNNKKISLINVIPKILIELTVVCLLLLFFISNKNFIQLENYLPELTILVISIIRVIPILNNITMSLNQSKYFNISKKIIIDNLKNYKIKKEKNEPSNKFLKSKFYKFNTLNIKNLCFYYKHKKNLFHNFNLSIKRGDKILIKGSSGRGKTSLINIILGLLSPTKGKISCNGFDIKNHHSDWLDIVSHVSQDSYLLDDTILNNIILNKKINLQRLEEILDISGLNQTIKKLPKKIKTNAGYMAKKLSGGQIQRISLARALYKNSQFLILDEPTSSLDEKIELEILKKLMSLKNKTIIVVAHKSTKFRFRFNKTINL